MCSPNSTKVLILLSFLIINSKRFVLRNVHFDKNKLIIQVFGLKRSLSDGSGTADKKCNNVDIRRGDPLNNGNF